MTTSPRGARRPGASARGWRKPALLAPMRRNHRMLAPALVHGMQDFADCVEKPGGAGLDPPPPAAPHGYQGGAPG
ncbi:hypothetical protein [Bordetella pertussis]|uniref:Uncharacterized protein n=2 Tax=Bordetella pertussis TaxID=520 RepID=Q7VY58_BORPE|nr:hypothetical protein [Bordetella pertussis]AEE66859.1 hypothetical protein BPTD_1485 [Bordetella pertussis CS]PNO95182.1 hypothetical protein AL465_017405 [Bordetella pertussis 18323]CAE41792.1 conserved hypothetical protein [Bordetella pertussis Tohama I]AIW91857.1 hypothetical protein B1917_1425 [Bordetella pertussis B1917]AIW95351.1 hypothetical protein B1920_1443 [Bordetella pertussis B1920]